MSQTIEQLKTEVSEEYIKQFKKELGWMKSLVLLPIENKVKEIILGQRELPATFDESQEFGRRKDIISFVTPRVSNEIFNFMKEKRLLLEQQHTEEELNNLKHQILTGEVIASAGATPPEANTNSEEDIGESEANKDIETQAPIANPDILSGDTSQTGVSEDNTGDESDMMPTSQPEQTHYGAASGLAVSSAGLGLGIQGLVERNHYKKGIENIETQKMRTTMESMVKMMQKELANPRYTELQKKNITKAMTEFESGLDSFDDNSIGLLKQRGKLGNKLPNKILDNLNLDVKTLAQLKGIEADLVGKSVSEMRSILDAKSITGISDEVLDALKNADNVEEFATMTNILSHANKLKRVSHFIKGMFAIDMVLLGVDVWMYFETMSEADAIRKINALRAKNKVSQANTQLVIALSSFAVELGIVVSAVKIGTIGGPFGILAGLVVGVIGAAVSHGVDVLYYDVQDFYTQNKEDYIRQSQTKLKQAILQHLHNKKFGNISLNEVIGAPDKTQKDRTLKESFESLIFLEELESGEYEDIGLLFEYKHSEKSKTKFVSSLSEDKKKLFRKQDHIMNKKIEARMQYIAKHYNDKEYVTHLKSSQGLSYLSQFIVDSGTYATLQKDGQWNDEISLDKNRESYVAKKLSILPKEIKDNLDVLYTQQPKLFSEISYGAKIYLDTTLNTDNLSEEDSLLKLKIQHIIDYQAAREFGKYNNKVQENIDYSHISYDYITRIIQNDYNVRGVAPTMVEESQINTIFGYLNERKDICPASSNLTQNIIYRLATELYDYQGENDMTQLIGHFSSSNAHTYGLYYDDAWYINNDYAVDQKLEFGDINTRSFSDKQLNKQVNAIIALNLYAPVLLGSNASISVSQGKIPLQRKSMVDTPTETIDSKLSQEFEKKLQSIIYEECSYRTHEHKQKIRQEIMSYIKQYAIDGKYIELPHYLIEDAMKSNIGDLTSVLCSYQDGKIVIASPDNITPIRLGKVVRQSIEPMRRSFSPSEQKYINEIEFAHRQLEKVRGIQGKWSHQDDLDLPREIEIEISRYYKERQQQKNRLLYIDSDIAKNQLRIAHKKYVEYFQTIYRGIISSRHGFGYSNDIDSADLFTGVMQDNSKKWIDTKTGKLRKNKEGELLFVPKGFDFEKTYDKIFDAYTYKGKKISYYLQSKKEEEKKLGIYLSKTIYFTLLEISSLQLNNNGEIQSFGSTGVSVMLSLITENKDMDISRQFYKRLEKNIDQTLTLEPIEISNKNMYQKKVEDLKLHTLTHREKKIVGVAQILQKKIEQTAKEIVRQGKRGNIIYDPFNHTLESRNHKIKITEGKNNTYKVGNYSESLSLLSALWLANFTNWYQYTYHKSDVEYRQGLSKYRPFIVTGLFSKKTSSLIMSESLLKEHVPELKSEKRYLEVSLLYE